MSCYDIAIIGGGVNGCGIARDAAGRGLSVYLCDKGDLGGATSSASTKLVHGGLRYLEHFEFRLVREALRERETLMRIAPHVVRPMRFVLPCAEGMRPWPLLRLGLFLYDNLGGRRLLPGAKSLDLRRDEAGIPLNANAKWAFEYSDCWVDDARLVVLNAMSAAESGARIEPRTRCVAAERAEGLWRIRVEGRGGAKEIRARGLVNAAGPWVSEVLGGPLRQSAASKVRLVRGSHIVVAKIFGHDRAYTFQQPDGRVVFAIPYEGDFTLIGTTDVDHQGSPETVEISEEETAYLCAAASRVFRAPVTPGDVVHAYSGVRPLYDDGASAAQEATRDYVLEVETGEGRPPLVSVFGGKITTYRKLAEAVMARLAEVMAIPQATWTARSPLPGGEFASIGIGRLTSALRSDYPFLDEKFLSSIVRRHGGRTRQVLGKARSVDDLGPGIGAQLTMREIRYLIDHVWAFTAEDVLWRRTKLGLRFTPQQKDELAALMPGGEA